MSYLLAKKPVPVPEAPAEPPKKFGASTLPKWSREEPKQPTPVAEMAAKLYRH